MRYSLLLVLFVACFDGNAQQFTFGTNLNYNSTQFRTSQVSPFNDRLNTFTNQPSIGIVLPTKKGFFLKEDVSLYDHVNDNIEYGGYYYQYSILATNTTLCIELDSGLYIGTGAPVGYILNAYQSNQTGTIDLLEVGNAPTILYGYSIVIGFKKEITDKLFIYLDLTRNAYLNSLDNDDDQNLMAQSYVFSIKMALSF